MIPGQRLGTLEKSQNDESCLNKSDALKYNHSKSYREDAVRNGYLPRNEWPSSGNYEPEPYGRVRWTDRNGRDLWVNPWYLSYADKFNL
jgi:hypothetical protein